MHSIKTKFKVKLVILILITSLSIHFISKKPKESSSTEWDELLSIETQIITQDEFIYKLSNVRNWNYENNQVIKKEYIDIKKNINNITNVWLIVEPFGFWNGIAHTYFTFDFADSPPLSFSIEARKEKGEKYNPIKGMFREFELMYTWGTEDDFLIRRAVYLDNQVYMYPLQIPNSWKRNLFQKLVLETNELKNNPKFYNTLNSNCTNVLADLVNEIRPNTLPFHYARYLTGYSDEYLYKHGYIPNHKSFDEINEKYNVTNFVRNNYKSDDFSNKLRNYLK